MFTNSDGIVADDKCSDCMFNDKNGCKRPSFIKCWKDKEGNNG